MTIPWNLIPWNKPKDKEDLYDENYKPLKNRRHKKREKLTMFLDQQDQHHQGVHITKSNIQIQHDPKQKSQHSFQSCKR